MQSLSNKQEKRFIVSRDWLRIILFFICFGISAPAFADWQWPNDYSVAKLNGKWYQTSLAFTNTGTNPVTVSDLSFSCSCTVFKFNSTTAKPSAGGKLAISVQRDDKHQDDKEISCYVFGTDSVTPKKLTIRLSDK
jgi:hypothetical protein